MDSETTLRAAGELLAPWAQATAAPDAGRLDITIAADALPGAAEALGQAGWGYLAAITGLDLGAAAGAIEVLYHFCAGPAVLTLRVRLPRDTPAVPSICDAIPAAGAFERELAEMLGVAVAGAPSTDRLYLPDDWPERVYPLRKDFVAAGYG